MSERIMWICPKCGGEFKYGEWDDGARQGSCPCGATRAIQIDGGTLDLGLIEINEDDSNQFKVFP